MSDKINIIITLELQYSPLNIGLNFQTEVGPRLENCPSDTSIKNTGIPAKASIMMYGTRNAPASMYNFKLDLTLRILRGITLTLNKSALMSRRIYIYVNRHLIFFIN